MLPNSKRRLASCAQGVCRSDIIKLRGHPPKLSIYQATAETQVVAGANDPRVR